MFLRNYVVVSQFSHFIANTRSNFPEKQGDFKLMSCMIKASDAGAVIFLFLDKCFIGKPKKLFAFSVMLASEQQNAVHRVADVPIGRRTIELVDDEPSQRKGKCCK